MFMYVCLHIHICILFTYLYKYISNNKFFKNLKKIEEYKFWHKFFQF